MSHKKYPGLQPADYEKQCKMDLWQVQEGICLLLDVEPSLKLLLKHGEYNYKCSHGDFWGDFNYFAKLCESSITVGKLQFFETRPNPLYTTVMPFDFLCWAKEKDIELTSPLTSLLEALANQQDNNSINETQEPVFSSETSTKSKRESQIVKRICQGIAQTIWYYEPTMTIEDMKKHHAIQEYGGGKYYSGKNTLRSWLSEVDPRDDTEKTGRPKKS